MPKAGRVALVGRPNAGKSTLLNALLAEKLAIVSDKPQTTRQRLVGILSRPEGQIVFFDTPGIHRPLHRLNRQMVDEALEAMRDADVVCLLVDASAPYGKGEIFVRELVEKTAAPRLLVLNKVDLVAKPKLLPQIARYAEGDRYAEIVPLSAATGDGCERLLAALFRLLPEGEPFYDAELLTLQPERFLVAERIREKVLAATAAELPFTTAVLVERWEETGEPPALLRLHASILVERSSQKPILIGRGGARIRDIGTAARLDLEQYLGRKVFLALNVRHEPDWRENARLLGELRGAPATS